ncbi:MAG: hypothetical protein K0R72_748, partial [Clostridia bacterium]|nr:hypothetical protein [Clostridia bacterium]
TILANNWQNADGTVTIYAKGKDSAGNEITVQKKVVSLDLDKPKVPVINSNAGYPILYEYGVNLDSTTSIIYDNRTDIDNYYSLDNGVTWLKYTGQFNLASGNIIAKSVKKTSGLESIVSITISMPADAITPPAYDGNEITRTADNAVNKYIKVNNTLGGKKVRIKMYAGWYPRVKCLNESGNILSSTDINGYPAHDSDIIITIPLGTNKITFTNELHGSSYVYPYEIGVSNEPGFTATNGYMLITADPTKEIKSPYQMVSISYFSTSVNRLYRIGTTGEWLNYNDQPIKVIHGQTIYAKGIDQYGIETRLITSYTSDVSNAITYLAFDGNEATKTADNAVNKYINIDSSLGGKKLRVKVYAGWAPRIKCLNEAGTALYSQDISAPSARDVDIIITVPIGTNRITFTNELNGSSYVYPYEFQVSNEPVFTATDGYMLLHLDSMKMIKNPYQMVSISYFPTNVQKLYRIGTTGDWITYNEQPIKIIQGQTIYAKGIDQYGIETRIISSYTSNVTNAITSLALDGNETTRTADNAVNKYINIDSGLGGKKLRVKMYAGWAPRIKCLNEAGTVLYSQDISAPSAIDVDIIITVPVGTNRITFTNELNGSSYVYPYEFQIVNEPTYTATNGYILLNADPTKSIKVPYQMVTVNYFPTSSQRLYRIGTIGAWLNYNDQAIKVDQGQTIYAKGIDQYGNETRITSSYNVNVANAIKANAYDANNTTYMTDVKGSYILEIDPSLGGKNITIRYSISSLRGIVFKFLDGNGVVLNTFTKLAGTYNETYIIPIGTKTLELTPYCTWGDSYQVIDLWFLYEITV